MLSNIMSNTCQLTTSASEPTVVCDVVAYRSILSWRTRTSKKSVQVTQFDNLNLHFGVRKADISAQAHPINSKLVAIERLS